MGEPSETIAPSGDGADSAPLSPRGFSRIGGSRRFKYVVAVFCVLVLSLLLLGFRWSREPRLFDVEDAARERAIEAGIMAADRPLPPGYMTASTLMTLIETLLHKQGGYLSNDLLPPGALLDNIPHWEYGVLTQVRDFTGTLRQDLSRSRAQSEERPELSEAEARLNYEHTAWAFPSAEKEFGVGLKHLQVYLDALSAKSGDRAVFAGRPDALAVWLRTVESRLGGITVRLRASSGVYRYDPRVMTSAELTQPPPENEDGELEEPGEARKTPWVEVDDVFYEARGAAWALYHLMKAMRHDLESVIDEQRAMGSMNRALSELYAALQPVRGPIVMNGQDFSMTPNHSITLAAYLAKAHLAVADLRALVGGSGNSR